MEQFDKEYINLQTEFVWLQQHIKKKNQRLMILFEGRDTAGKGGAIMRFVRFLNPRLIRIVALPKPTKLEKGQWYFQRYLKHLPNAGEIVFFDRSWYNRAVVEPVMGFCTKKQYNQFISQVTFLEKVLVNDGIVLIKFWFSIDQHEQQKRLLERVENPLKQWKLSTVDVKAQAKWDDYTHYKSKMFKNTSTPEAPWIVINGNDRDKARKEAMRYVLSLIDYDKKGETGERITPDQTILKEYALL